MSKPITSLQNIKNIYFLGIAGQLMSALACVTREFGYEVTGSDENAYPPATTYLENHNISWINGHKPENIGHPGLVVLGNHIRQGNPELDALLQSKIPFVSYPQMVRLLFPDAKFRIVIAGTHGKSTTTSLLGWILTQAGLNPTVLIGAQSKNFDSSFRLGNRKILVIEGDEYTSSCLDDTPKFLYYQPTHAAITSAELDHMDVFDTWTKQATAFEQFASSVSQLLLLCGDTITNKLQIKTPARTEKYGLNKFDWQATNIHQENSLTKFDVLHKNKLLGSFSMSLTGNHYVQDALAAIALSQNIGVKTQVIQSALATFSGVGKRFEILLDSPKYTVIDDYAHHPTAIKTTLEAARSRYPGKRLWGIYEPHTFTRIKGLLPEFSHAFDSADQAIVADIYPAREKALIGLVHATDVVNTAQTGQPQTQYIATPEEVLTYLKEQAQPGDIFLFMTVGRFGDTATKLTEFLKSPEHFPKTV